MKSRCVMLCCVVCLCCFDLISLFWSNITKHQKHGSQLCFFPSSRLDLFKKKSPENNDFFLFLLIKFLPLWPFPSAAFPNTLLHNVHISDCDGNPANYCSSSRSRRSHFSCIKHASDQPSSVQRSWTRDLISLLFDAGTTSCELLHKRVFCLFPTSSSLASQSDKKSTKSPPHKRHSP